MRNSGKFGNIFIALLIAASFAIAGCGGGGGTAAVEEPPAMPDPTPQEMCEGDGGRYNADGSCTSAADVAAEMAEATALSDAQDAAMAAFTAAMAAVYGAVDPVAMANAQVQAAAAGTANAAAQAATTSEDAMTHQMAAEAARDMAVEAGMTRGLGITTVANAAANKSAIDSAALIGVPAPAPISNAGRVGAALNSAAGAAIANNAGVNTDNDADNGAETIATINQGRVNNAVPPVHIGQVTVAASHTGTAPRFTVNAVTGNNGNAPPAPLAVNTLRRGETPAALVMSGEKPGGGWEGAEMTRSRSGPAGWRENAVIYTDINPPGQAYNAAGAINLRDLNGNNALDEAPDANGNLDTVVDQAVITGEIPGDGSHFAATYNENPTDGNPARSGRFFCGAILDCSISVDATGVVRAIQGYVFQPAIPGVITRPDSDYLAWGVWVSVPNAVPGTDANGPTNPATAAAFAAGNNPFAVPAALTGSATYNGAATGLYSAAGMVEYFEADASLMANFGGRSGVDSNPRNNVADTLLFGAVTGSITNIKAGGMDVDGSLTLGRAPVLSADGVAAATTFSGSTGGTLGGRAMSGAWHGQFYGPNRAAGVAVRTEFPTTAAGTFGANSVIPGTSILGAFGARKAD